jgi:predicted O-methyltransferase YrrM
MKMIVDYVKYLIQSHNLHGVHSPFVYDLNLNVLNKTESPVDLQPLENYLDFLKDEQTILKLEEIGGNSRITQKTDRKVSEIYWTSSTSERMGIMLANIIHHYKIKNVIELGTCLGVGTGYLWQALSQFQDASLTSIEGRKELYDYTRGSFSKYFIPHRVNFVQGNFDQVLPDILKLINQVDLAFVDGNHRYEPTMNYFEMLLDKVHPGSILIFDDIYWSDEMKQAWREIISNPAVTCSIDLFRWGMVFFRKELPKQHYTLRFNGFLKAHIM